MDAEAITVVVASLFAGFVCVQLWKTFRRNRIREHLHSPDANIRLEAAVFMITKCPEQIENCRAEIAKICCDASLNLLDQMVNQHGRVSPNELYRLLDWTCAFGGHEEGIRLLAVSSFFRSLNISFRDKLTGVVHALAPKESMPLLVAELRARCEFGGPGGIGWLMTTIQQSGGSSSQDVLIDCAERLVAPKKGPWDSHDDDMRFGHLAEAAWRLSFVGDEKAIPILAGVAAMPDGGNRNKYFVLERVCEALRSILVRSLSKVDGNSLKVLSRLGDLSFSSYTRDEAEPWQHK